MAIISVVVTVLLQFLSNLSCLKTGGVSETIQHMSASNINDDKITVTTSEILSLESIRSTLVRQEETIIFALIERAQFRRNHEIYDTKLNKLRNIYGAPLSFLEFMLIETEKLHAKVRRYTSPEEHAFYPNLLPPPILPVLDYPTILSQVDKNVVNVNAEVLRWYTEKIIDRLCISGDDEQHGSSVLCDISALQALSRRIHYGKFVAESKFQKDTDLYTRLIRAGDAAAVVELLTNVEVERNVLRRALLKASTYGQDIVSTFNSSSLETNQNSATGYKIEPMLIADIYRDMVIPLTKDVEVRYLFHRVGCVPPPPDAYYHLCRGPLDAFTDEK